MVDEQLTSVQLFKEIVDPSLEELAPYLLQFLHQIVVPCFYKHRKRVNSKDVRFYHMKVIHVNWHPFILGNETVVRHKLLVDLFHTLTLWHNLFFSHLYSLKGIILTQTLNFLLSFKFYGVVKSLIMLFH